MSDSYDYSKEKVIEDASDVETLVMSTRLLSLENKAKAGASGAAPTGKSDDLFATQEASDGKSFMAVKPWLGAIVAPSNAPKNNPAAPDKSLALDWVYGYRGYDTTGNTFVNAKNHLVYPAAAVMVLFDPVTHTQRHFTGHTDDITCVAQHPKNKNIFVSGQVATVDRVSGHSVPPHICVFDSEAAAQSGAGAGAGALSVLKGASLQRAVLAVAFSPDGQYVVSVGADDAHTVTVWDWQKKTAVASDKADTNPVLAVKWNHVTASEFVTVGVKHVYVWSFSNGALSKKRAQMGGSPLQTFHAVAFSEKGYPCVGAHDGSIYIFVDKMLKKTVPAAHKGPVYTLDYYPGGLVTGGDDGKAVIFDKTLNVLHTHVFKHAVRSVYISGTQLVVGTAGCEIYTVNDFKAPAGDPKPVVSGHYDGELWALAVHPTQASVAATVGEDNSIVLYDLAKHVVTKRGVIDPKAGAKVQIKKASTMSRHPVNQCARGTCFSPDGRLLAVGTNAGTVRVFAVQGDVVNPVATVDLNNCGKRQLDNQTQNWIEALSFNPAGTLLAVGTHGMVIVLLDVKAGFKPVATLKAHNAPVTKIDWAADGAHIQSTCRAYELLFHDVDCAHPDKAVHNSHPAQLKDVNWATQSCCLGWPVQGIFNPSMDGTDVNAVARSPSKSLLAVADDFGHVSIYRYPVLEWANKSKAYSGHSSHVQNVQFTADEKFVLSAGGNDKCLMQWKII